LALERADPQEQEPRPDKSVQNLTSRIKWSAVSRQGNPRKKMGVPPLAQEGKGSFRSSGGIQKKKKESLSGVKKQAGLKEPHQRKEKPKDEDPVKRGASASWEKAGAPKSVVMDVVAKTAAKEKEASRPWGEGKKRGAVAGKGPAWDMRSR